jgi:hypothetical protein
VQTTRARREQTARYPALVNGDALVALLRQEKNDVLYTYCTRSPTVNLNVRKYFRKVQLGLQLQRCRLS